MPRYTRMDLGSSYQTAYREGRWYLQRLNPTSGGWEDIGEGSKQRGSQVEKWRRIEMRRVHAARNELVASGTPCAHPQEWRQHLTNAYHDEKHNIHYPAQERCSLCCEVLTVE